MVKIILDGIVKSKDNFHFRKSNMLVHFFYSLISIIYDENQNQFYFKWSRILRL